MKKFVIFILILALALYAFEDLLYKTLDQTFVNYDSEPYIIFSSDESNQYLLVSEIYSQSDINSFLKKLKTADNSPIPSSIKLENATIDNGVAYIPYHQTKYVLNSSDLSLEVIDTAFQHIANSLILNEAFGVKEVVFTNVTDTEGIRDKYSYEELLFELAFGDNGELPKSISYKSSLSFQDIKLPY